MAARARAHAAIKIGTLRRLGGIRVSLEAIALSIISLGIVDAVAMLPPRNTTPRHSAAAFALAALTTAADSVNALGAG